MHVRDLAGSRDQLSVSGWKHGRSGGNPQKLFKVEQRAIGIPELVETHTGESSSIKDAT